MNQVTMEKIRSQIRHGINVPDLESGETVNIKIDVLSRTFTVYIDNAHDVGICAEFLRGFCYRRFGHGQMEQVLGNCVVVSYIQTPAELIKTIRELREFGIIGKLSVVVEYDPAYCNAEIYLPECAMNEGNREENSEYFLHRGDCMNAINRGAIIGLRITLQDIATTLTAISNEEAQKECAGYGGVPIDFRGETSGSIYDAVQSIEEAIKILQKIVPIKADFEEYFDS